MSAAERPAGSGTLPSYARPDLSYPEFVTVPASTVTAAVLSYVITGTTWSRIIMASLLYTSNASVGVRYPGLQIVDTAGAVRAEVDAPSGQNPSVAVVYTWAPNIGSALGLKSNPQSMPWPDVYLPSGWSIQAYALSALAGDTIGPLSLTLQQAPTGPGVTALPLLPTPLLV